MSVRGAARETRGDILDGLSPAGSWGDRPNGGACATRGELRRESRRPCVRRRQRGRHLRAGVAVPARSRLSRSGAPTPLTGVTSSPGPLPGPRSRSALEWIGPSATSQNGDRQASQPGKIGFIDGKRGLRQRFGCVRKHNSLSCGQSTTRSVACYPADFRALFRLLQLYFGSRLNCVALLHQSG